MNRLSLYAVTLAAAFAAGHAAAADASAPKTREQVKAELAEAVRTGNIVAGGDTGLKANELAPHRYPVQATGPGKTRDEVKAELREAIRRGQMPVYQGA